MWDISLVFTIWVFGVSGIAHARELARIVCGVFEKEKCCISEEDLEHCHRLKENNRLIVKFTTRKHCQQVIIVKSNIINFKLNNLKFSKGSKCFINQNYSLHYRIFQSVYKKRTWKIYGWCISNSTIKTKFQKNTRPTI